MKLLQLKKLKINTKIVNILVIKKWLVTIKTEKCQKEILRSE